MIRSHLESLSVSRFTVWTFVLQPIHQFIQRTTRPSSLLYRLGWHQEEAALDAFNSRLARYGRHPVNRLQILRRGDGQIGFGCEERTEVLTGPSRNRRRRDRQEHLMAPAGSTTVNHSSHAGSKVRHTAIAIASLVLSPITRKVVDTSYIKDLDIT